MSDIAQAIADRQSEIDRLQAEIKALTDVEEMLGASARPASRSTSRRSSSRRKPAAAEVRRQAGEQVRRQAGEEAPADDGRGEEGGVGTDDRLLGRTQEASRQEVVPGAP